MNDFRQHQSPKFNASDIFHDILDNFFIRDCASESKRVLSLFSTSLESMGSSENMSKFESRVYEIF